MNTDAGSKHSPTRDFLPLLWVFLAALTLRMIWLFQYQHSPFFNNPSLDFTYFNIRAQEILQGHWFSETYLFNPLYPLFLAAIYPIFGTDLFFPRLVQALLGASSTILVYHIATRSFDRRTGLIAAGLLAIYLPLIYYDGILMASSLLSFLLLLAVFLLMRAHDSAGNGKSFLLYPAAGAVFGLVLLGRPNFLLPAGLLSIWAAFSHTPSQPRRNRLCGSTLFLACALLIIAPITWFHRIHSGDFIIVAPHGGFNFYIGNHPGATGAYMSIPGISDLPGQQIEDSRQRASEKLGQPVTAREASDYWMSQSMEFIRSQPVQYLKLTARKIALFWNAAEIPSEYSIDFDRRLHSLLRLPLPRFGLIAPLGLTGIFLALPIVRSRRKPALLPGLVVFGTMIAVVIFFVHARYRMASTPWICMFASFCISELIRMTSERRWKAMAATGALLASLTAFTRLPLTEFNDLPGYYNLGHAWISAGNPAAAVDCFHYILERDNSLKTWLSLGEVHMQVGNSAEAEKAFENVLIQDPGHFDALLNLGMIFSSSGRDRHAEEVLMRAAALHPERVEARVNLAILLMKMERYEEVRRIIDGLDRSGERQDVLQTVDQIRQLLESKLKMENEIR